MTRKNNKSMIQNLSSEKHKEKPETKNQTTPNHNRTPPLRTDTRRPQESKINPNRVGGGVLGWRARNKEQPTQGGRWGPWQEGQKQEQSSGGRPGGRPQQAQNSGGRPGCRHQQAQSSGGRLDLYQRRGGRLSRVEAPPKTLWNSGGVEPGEPSEAEAEAEASPRPSEAEAEASPRPSEAEAE
ncbi:hypothetical protein AMECASPLE_020775, partial [Ameca splendens]